MHEDVRSKGLSRGSSQYFRLVSEGGGHIARGNGRGCPSTLEVTKDCNTPDHVDNWNAATGQCLISPPASDYLFSLPSTVAPELDKGKITDELQKPSRQMENPCRPVLVSKSRNRDHAGSSFKARRSTLLGSCLMRSTSTSLAEPTMGISRGHPVDAAVFSP